MEPQALQLVNIQTVSKPGKYCFFEQKGKFIKILTNNKTAKAIPLKENPLILLNKDNIVIDKMTLKINNTNDYLKNEVETTISILHNEKLLYNHFNTIELNGLTWNQDIKFMLEITKIKNQHVIGLYLDCFLIKNS